MPELIELAGGVAIGARAGAPAPTITSAELSALAPDIVLIKPCGFTIERTLQERETIVHDIQSAVPKARLFVSDGNAFFNRPGPRLVESLEILAACTHPATFPDLAAKHACALVTLDRR
jgi:iron complex transport system substrate-binding protein